ncbi:putative RNA methyltransferase [Nonomuraea sp. NPDC050536]|uniref:putative RNA methyltransferase n=1 Tax=Nonomuraea sp. NPDC050536 TaxID=3364366 RepID=UPI0037C967D6
MLSDITRYLVCPVCRAGLAMGAGVVRCAAGHSFDIAKQGYVSLLVGSRPPGTADSAEMVAARAAFLEAGHYAPLARALAETVGQAGVIVDAGAGTGYYLHAVLGDAAGIAFDVSKHAIKRAARIPGRVGAFVADVWQPLPIADGVADAVLNVFAPRNGPEFARILRPGGALVVVTPGPGHLRPLVDELGLLSVDEDKERRLARSLPGFSEISRREVAFDLELTGAEVSEVVGMGPSAWHTDAAELERRISGYISQNAAGNPEKVLVTAEFNLSIFETAPSASAVP